MDYVKKQAIFLIEKINLINKILKKEVNELNVPNKIKEATKEFNYIIQTLELNLVLPGKIKDSIMALLLKLIDMSLQSNNYYYN